MITMDYIVIAIQTLFVFVGYVAMMDLVEKHYQTKSKKDIAKISRNTISASHAFIIMILYIFGYEPAIQMNFSIPYYLYDLIIELSGGLNWYSSAMICHHLSSIYIASYLANLELGPNIYFGFFIIEISNIPLYIVYHLKTIRYENKIIVKIFICFEILFSLIFRFGFGIPLIYKMWFLNTPWLIHLSYSFILVISVLWLNRLWRQLTG